MLGWKAGTELGRDAQLWAGSAWQLTGQKAVVTMCCMDGADRTGAKTSFYSTVGMKGSSKISVGKAGKPDR